MNMNIDSTLMILGCYNSLRISISLTNLNFCSLVLNVLLGIHFMALMSLVLLC